MRKVQIRAAVSVGTDGFAGLSRMDQGKKG